MTACRSQRSPTCDSNVDKPKFAMVFNNRGTAYGHKGQNDRAIQDYDLAISPQAGFRVTLRDHATARSPMPHHTPLIATIVAGIVLAFVLGTVANRLRLSPLVGYLVAGVLIGPFTPGYVADQALAPQLAEIGVILLMFGVGLHFSLPELLAVRTIALPGAAGQIALVSVLGIAVAYALGWSIGGGIVFGLALSVASTAVVLHALQQRRLVETDRGRIAVGWLVVQDLVTALALVLLPAFAGLLGGKPVEQVAIYGVPGWLGSESIWASLALTILKFAAFLAVLLVIGRRVIPWMLHYAAHTGSRELFRLAVLAIALGVAFGSAGLFGVSFALGAFFAGMVLAESTLSQQAANEVIPLRDAFAVLFFVSVGMLFNPAIVVREPLTVGATFLIIVAGNALAAFTIVLLFRHPLRTAITLGVSLSQIAEFSFILSDLGIDLKLLPADGRDLILRRITLGFCQPATICCRRSNRPVAKGARAAEDCGRDFRIDSKISRDGVADNLADSARRAGRLRPCWQAGGGIARRQRPAPPGDRGAPGSRERTEGQGRRSNLGQCRPAGAFEGS